VAARERPPRLLLADRWVARTGIIRRQFSMQYRELGL